MNTLLIAAEIAIENSKLQAGFVITCLSLGWGFWNQTKVSSSLGSAIF
jgi:hypothetical protein